MIELTGPDATALVDLEAGGRLASLFVAGRERLVTGGPQAGPMAWGSYPMAPWAGRLRRGRLSFAGRSYQLPIDAAPHAIHGTVYRRAWRVDHDGSIVTELGPDWPFPGRARQRFELAPEALRCTLEVHAVCVEPQTGPPDGPNLAPHVVEPGSPLSVSMVVSWA